MVPPHSARRLRSSVRAPFANTVSGDATSLLFRLFYFYLIFCCCNTIELAWLSASLLAAHFVRHLRLCCDASSRTTLPASYMQFPCIVHPLGFSCAPLTTARPATLVLSCPLRVNRSQIVAIVSVFPPKWQTITLLLRFFFVAVASLEFA